jgi:hypothetical protein
MDGRKGLSLAISEQDLIHTVTYFREKPLPRHFLNKNILQYVPLSEDYKYFTGFNFCQTL